MSKQEWVSLYGNTQIADGVIALGPSQALASATTTPSAEGGAPSPPHAIVRSNLEFDQGIISWEAKLSDPSDRVQLMLPIETTTGAASTSSVTGASMTPDLSVGLNVLGAPYGFALWPGSGTWEPVAGAGHGSVLPVGEWIPLSLSVRGSIIEFYVRGVKVLWTTQMLRRGQITVLLQGHGECAIRDLKVMTDQPLCFAVMQFTEEFNVLYQDVIKPICESYGYKVVRADEFCTSGQIMDDVIQSIRSSALIVADITPDNANVFYELGFAHAIRKPTILLSDKRRERLPFDVSGLRTLFYDNTIGGKAVVEARLRQHLDALRSR
jgi:hypothetical protein